MGADTLKRIGEADSFGSLDHLRRSDLWQVKGLADSPLPLFAADRSNAPWRDEATEPDPDSNKIDTPDLRPVLNISRGDTLVLGGLDVQR